MYKKILVTGGNGQLGCTFRKIAENRTDCEFIFTDMPEVDITDKSCVDKVVKENNIDLIINCAAYTDVNKAESCEDLAFKVNAVGPKTLAEVCKENGAKLIHISTDYVFDGTRNIPLKESDQVSPLGAYGRTKLAGEEEVISSGCNVAIVRTAWLYSEYGNNFVKTMLRLGGERETLNVVYDQVGTPTYAFDLASACMVIAEKGISGCEIYHYSNEGSISWYDFASAIMEIGGVSCKVGAIETHEYPTPAPRPAYSVLNKRKIKDLGVVVPNWRDSLVKCIKNLNK